MAVQTEVPVETKRPVQDRTVAGPLERVGPQQTFWRGFIPACKDVYAHRELLGNLVRKELKVKYKDSVLGFLWSLLRPMMMLAIYYVAIGKFLGTNIPGFAVYLFSGLIAWTLFTDVLGGCTGSIVGNAGLIKKIYFPRELLPLSVVGAAMVHFFLQVVVLVVAELAFGWGFWGTNLLYIPLAFLALTLFMTAVGLLLASLNVFLRDTQHLIELVLLLWFWMTPIVYPIVGATKKLADVSHLLLFTYLANPMANVVIGFQRGFYKDIYNTETGDQILYAGPVTKRLLVTIAASAVLLFFAQRIFARRQGDFAQEL